MLKSISNEELLSKINSHKLWLNGDDGSKLRLINYDLKGSDLRGSDLSGSNLSYSDYGSIQCPEEGAFIGFKKGANNTLIKLLIPEDAQRSSATSRKCRCSKANVITSYSIHYTKLYDLLN